MSQDIDKDILIAMDSFQRHFIMTRTDAMFKGILSHLKIFASAVRSLVWNHPYPCTTGDVLGFKVDAVRRELMDGYFPPNGCEDIKEIIVKVATVIREDMLKVQYGFENVAQGIVEQILKDFALAVLKSTRHNKVIK